MHVPSPHGRVRTSNTPFFPLKGCKKIVMIVTIVTHIVKRSRSDVPAAFEICNLRMSSYGDTLLVLYEERPAASSFWQSFIAVASSGSLFSGAPR